MLFPAGYCLRVLRYYTVRVAPSNIMDDAMPGLVRVQLTVCTHCLELQVSQDVNFNTKV